ncbi:MAG: FHA domain-containing protein [Planctomycetaceae bacterium]|nr:FHA domain-containing protein [Planctomycetaceae bacterium]
MKKLTLISDGLAEGQVELTPDQLPAVLGRSKSADVTINDGLLSRRHSEIVLNSAGDFEIRDLDSTNLTIVNEHDVPRHVLRTGDVILLGDTQISVEVTADPTLDPSEQTTRELDILPPADA